MGCMLRVSTYYSLHLVCEAVLRYNAEDDGNWKKEQIIFRLCTCLTSI